MFRKELIALVFISAIYFGLCLPTLVMAYQLPDTGQHTCYDDQGNEITCPEPAYQDNGDGTVTDLNTGLIWMQNTADTDGDGDIDSGDELDWQPACDYCADLSYAGHSDWRLPNRRELISIVDYGRSDPAIDRRLGAALPVTGRAVPAPTTRTTPGAWASALVTCTTTIRISTTMSSVCAADQVGPLIVNQITTKTG